MTGSALSDFPVEDLPNRSGLGREYGKPHDGTYFMNWNPLLLSSDLPAGKIVGKDFLGTRVIVYRDAEGRPVVQSAYCPHVGTDLSLGAIVDGTVRCPYHFWKFATDGRCVEIPGGVQIPNGARVYNYPAAERWGIVWAFNGETPLYGLPEFPNVAEEDLVFLAGWHGLRPVEGYIGSSNFVDFQHLEWVHGVKNPLPDSIVYEDYLVKVHQTSPERSGDSYLYGCTWLALNFHYNDGSDRFFMAGSSQVAPGLGDAFYVVAIRREEAEKLGEQAAQEVLQKKIAYLKKLYSEDEPILFSIRFRGRRGKLVESDAHLARALRYFEKYPRAAPFDV